jgi:hypothetical protein
MRVERSVTFPRERNVALVDAGSQSGTLRPELLELLDANYTILLWVMPIAHCTALLWFITHCVVNRSEQSQKWKAQLLWIQLSAIRGSKYPRIRILSIDSVRRTKTSWGILFGRTCRLEIAKVDYYQCGYSDVDIRGNWIPDVELLLFYCCNPYKQYCVIAELHYVSVLDDRAGFALNFKAKTE